MDLLEGGIEDPIRHWYYAHKFRFIRRIVLAKSPLPQRLIDVGAGSALFSLELLCLLPNLEVFAIDTGYLDPIYRDVNKRITYKTDGNGIQGDIYLFTDVLEHVASDIQMLRRYVNFAPVNSQFVITVPAFMSLWSGHDVFLKHFRRYKRKQINSVVELAGLRVLKSQYLYSSIFPIVWLMRKLPVSRRVSSQLKSQRVFVNSIMLFILSADLFMSRFFRFGSSVLVHAIKEDANPASQHH